MPQDIEVDINPNKTLLQLAQENNIKIKSICNGKPSCAECRVKILEGSNNVPPPGKEELNLIGTSYFIDNRRLSCQVRCFGSVTVDLTEQLAKIDTQKKIKGVKTKDQKDVHAKQDTLILSGDDNPVLSPNGRSENKDDLSIENKSENKAQNRPENKSQNRSQNRPQNKSQNKSQIVPNNKDNQRADNNQRADSHRQDNRPQRKPDPRPDIRAQNEANNKLSSAVVKPIENKDSKD